MVRLIKTLRTALNADLKHMHIHVLTRRRKKGLKKQKQLKDDIRKMIQEKRIYVERNIILFIIELE